MGDDGLFPIRILHKRPVPNVYEKNTFRVVGRDEDCIEYGHPRRSPSHCLPHCPQPSTKNVLGQGLTPYDRSTDFVPSTRKAGYPTHLLSNVRTLMDPVIDVRTNGIPIDNGGAWWRHMASGCVPSVPVYNPCTTSRIDYPFKCGPTVQCVTDDGCTQQLRVPNTRFSANPQHYYTAAVGPAPETCVNQSECAEGCMPVYRRERVSYEHGYNSREDPNYPNRGHREGSFVGGKPRPIHYSRSLGPIPSDVHLCTDTSSTLPSPPPTQTSFSQPLPDIGHHIDNTCPQVLSSC